MTIALYAVSEQLHNILIEPEAYLDCYPQKAPIEIVCPEDWNRLNSQHPLCNQTLRDRSYRQLFLLSHQRTRERRL
jgi:hypothetical protein